MRPALPSLTVLCLILSASSALAYQPLVTEDTGTQGAAGNNQLELSWLYSHNSSTGITTKSHGLPLVYTRGITDAFDLYAGASHTYSQDSTGLKDSSDGNGLIGAKWRYYEAAGTSFGVKAEVQLPTNTTKTSYATTLIVTHETGFGAIQGNLAYAQVNPKGMSSDRKDQWRISTAPVWQASEQIKVALDLGWITNPDSSKRSTMGYALLGGVYSPNPDLDLSLGFQKVLDNPHSDTWQTSLGVTWRFK